MVKKIETIWRDSRYGDNYTPTLPGNRSIETSDIAPALLKSGELKPEKVIIEVKELFDLIYYNHNSIRLALHGKDLIVKEKMVLYYMMAISRYLMIWKLFLM